MPAAPSAPAEPLFAELQGFVRPWWWLVLVVGAVPVGMAFVSVRHHPLLLAPRLLLLGVPAMLAALFAWLRLDTRLDAAGVSYRMRPLGWRRLAWPEVRQAYVREYSPIAEYGGWGIKGISFKNYAFNVAGNQGLQLELADGRRILLGTQRPDELRQALENLRVNQPI